MKTIDTLVEDINEVIKGSGGWTSVINEHFKEDIGAVTLSRLGTPKEERKPTLRMSNIGTPCTRKLWYSLNRPETGEELRPATLLKFMYGDMLESLILSLAEAAGHKVEGKQTVLDCYGIKGSRDAVIDGVTIDVKSASTRAMDKFRSNGLRSDDPFGYLRQLTGYVHGAKDDPLVKDKTGGAFLVVDKQHGHIVLDYYDLSKELGNMEEYVNRIKEKTAKDSKLPNRKFKTEAEGKSGNRKLGINCSYCDFKQSCYPDLRTFIYSRGPVYLTRVVKEPIVPEVT